MEPSVQQMRRRGTLFSNVFPFKKILKSPSPRILLTPLLPGSASSSESLNFIPNYVVVRVVQANLTSVKGKPVSELSNVYAKVSIGKEKLETSTIEKGADILTWEEEALTLEIPEQGNTAAITVGIYQRKRISGDECLGVTALFLREFQPSQKQRLMTCSLHSKADPSRSVGEAIISVAFRPSADAEPVSPEWNHEINYGGSCKSLNVFGFNNSEHGKLRRNSSFNTETQLPLDNKPFQRCITPVVQVTEPKRDTDSDDSDEMSAEDLQEFVRSARGRVNSLFEIEGRESGETICAGTSKLSRVSDISTENREEEEDEELEEFRWKTKKALITMILTLREVITEQDEKMMEMQDYIDNRLATILESNPALLDASVPSNTQ